MYTCLYLISSSHLSWAFKLFQSNNNRLTPTIRLPEEAAKGQVAQIGGGNHQPEPPALRWHVGPQGHLVVKTQAFVGRKFDVLCLEQLPDFRLLLECHNGNQPKSPRTRQTVKAQRTFSSSSCTWKMMEGTSQVPYKNGSGHKMSKINENNT